MIVGNIYRLSARELIPNEAWQNCRIAIKMRVLSCALTRAGKGVRNAANRKFCDPHHRRNPEFCRIRVR
jgi:hypothetical protein